jgi:hypothetical protein
MATTSRRSEDERMIAKYDREEERFQFDMTEAEFLKIALALREFAKTAHVGLDFVVRVAERFEEKALAAKIEARMKVIA